MSQRRIWCLNSETLGLNVNRPQTPAEEEPPRRQGVLDEEQDRVNVVLAENVTSEQTEQIDETQEPQTQPQLSPGLDLPTIAKLFAMPSLRSGTDPAGSSCRPNAYYRADEEPYGTEHYRNQLKKLQTVCGAQENLKLNNIFIKRLEEIDNLDERNSGDSLRLVTYQDWVDLLLHVNYIILSNMSEMEMEAYKKIMIHFQSVRGETNQMLDENRKLRKDMCAIIKLVQAAYHHGNWNTNDMVLETLTVNQLLGIQADQSRPESETDKINNDMKSLATEVASKHDEIRQLKAKICELDEMVLTARQKIIMKDQSNAQLHQQLLEMEVCLANTNMNNNTMSPADEGDYREDFDSTDFTTCLLDGLYEKDQQSGELLRMLNKELLEYMKLSNQKDYEAMEGHRKLLSRFFERIDSARAAALCKLENLRSHLQALDCDLGQLDPPVAAGSQMAEDFDMQLVDSLRRRLYTINETNQELNNRYNSLEIQYNVEITEAKSKYNVEHSTNLKNCATLKQIADLLSDQRSCTMSYKQMYSDDSAPNPFCDAILDIFDKLENIKEQETQLLATPSNSESKTPPHTTTTQPIAATTTVELTTTTTTTATTTSN